MKLITTITQIYKKGEIYNLAEADHNIPKYEYTKYFENSDEDRLTKNGEWCAEDRCKKTFKVVTKIYTN